MSLHLSRFLIEAGVLLVALPVLAAASDWDSTTHPTHGPAEVIGGPAAGCISGAVALPPQGRGYQAMKLSRHRTHGHPTLVHFVLTLGEALEARRLGVMLVGDLSQPRGGPTPSLHRSHQNGLDVDIWYWLPEEARERHLGRSEVEGWIAPSMLTADHQSLDPAQWTPLQVEMLRLAAAHDAVDRIFVHPLIKKALCDQEQGQEWLHKLRPWWGHDDHMHVRLRCPPGDDRCVPQQPVPPGDGCGEDLDWWLEAIAEPPTSTPRPIAPALPVACRAVLRAP
jgi:penicillin-insensitive murein endopeptidase